MDILVIGNGFDLAHDLKTSYKDFLENCNKITLQEFSSNTKNNYKEFCCTNLWMKHFVSKQKELGDTWIDLETEIYNIIESIVKLPAIKGWGNNTKLCPQLFSINKNDKAFNFYKFEQYLNRPLYEPDTDKKEYTLNVYNQQKDSFYVYIKTAKGFRNFLYDQLREFTKHFENYLTIDVLPTLEKESKYLLSLQSIGIAPQEQDVHILSFNYTDTCEKLYKNKFNTYCQLKIKPVYVHGKVNSSDDCCLVLGTHSFDNKDKGSYPNSGIPVKFNIFRKHNQRHMYGTIDAYQNLIQKITNPKKVISPVFHVVGHSLDKTDHKILKHLFLINKNAKINIYYHNEEAQERLINNITEIIGEEEVMSKVRLIYQHDKKRGILRLKTES